MKKSTPLSLIAATLLSLGASAQSNVLFPDTMLKSTAKEKTTQTASSREKAPAFSLQPEDAAYYPAPAGVYYLGLTIENDMPDEAAVAPTGVDIKFHCPLDLDYNDYEWTYINANGREVDAENEDIVMNVSDVSLVDAPYLYAMGYWGRGGYTMAREGIIFGQGYYGKGTDISYPSNLNTANIKGEFFDPAVLAVNYEEAGKNFADNYPLKLSDVTIKGFGELFRYAAPYSFDILRAAVVYSDGEIEAGDMVAEIYPYSEENGVDFDSLLGSYKILQASYNDSYYGKWYGVDFEPEGEAPVITSDVMVIFRPADGCEKIISPSFAGIETLYDGEPATNFVYASYTRNGNTVENGCLNYSGVTLEGNRDDAYLYHWTVSGKMNFDVKQSGISDAVIAQPADDIDAPVYNLTGIKVATRSSLNTLPAGIYIVNGKKLLVK